MVFTERKDNVSTFFIFRCHDSVSLFITQITETLRNFSPFIKKENNYETLKSGYRDINTELNVTFNLRHVI